MATVAGSLRNKVLVVDDLTSGDITVTDLVVSGTVTLQGTATTLDSTNTTITDSIIELNSGLTGANTKDIGFVFERGSTGNNAAFIWDESADRFTVITTAGTAADNTLSGTVANFQAGSFFGNGANLTSLNGSNISSGTVAAARIASLAASKITSGTFADARIPSLAASKITSGTFADARIPSLAASKITSGTFADARISSSSVTQHLGSYLTGNQTITLSGDVSGSGTTSISVTVNDDSHNHNHSDGDFTVNGGLVVEGSKDPAASDMGFYESAGTNIILKGDGNGRSGLFFESEKNGTNINDPTDYGFIQFHAYGHSGTSGENADFVIGVSNDSADHVIIQSPYNGGVKVGYKDTTSGTGLTTQTVFHDAYHPNADTLTTARTIAGTSFNGSANIDINYNNLTNKPTIPAAANNATITISAGTNLTGGGNFTTNQSSNETITINHEDVSSQGSVNNSGGTVNRTLP